MLFPFGWLAVMPPRRVAAVSLSISAAENIVKIDELTISGARWMIQQF
jgi:hypothetical protein